MESNLLETTIEDVLGTAFADVEGDLLVVDPSAGTVVALVETAVGRSDLPNLSLFVDERVLKDVMDDFLVASRAADLVADGTLSIRTLPDRAENTLLVSEDRVVVLVTTGSNVAALSTDDEAFVDTVADTYREAFAAAETYELRTPPISRIRETMADEIGSDARADFDAMLEAIEGTNGVLDEVTVSLLVAARNEVLLYDVSKWGEDVGIASKATFSRTKTRLEELGLIDTEKVPIDVGRPRLRLTLGDDRLIGTDVSDFPAIVAPLLG